MIRGSLVYFLTVFAMIASYFLGRIVMVFGGFSPGSIIPELIMGYFCGIFMGAALFLIPPSLLRDNRSKVVTIAAYWTAFSLLPINIILVLFVETYETVMEPITVIGSTVLVVFGITLMGRFIK